MSEIDQELMDRAGALGASIEEANYDSPTPEYVVRRGDFYVAVKADDRGALVGVLDLIEQRDA